VHPDLAKLARKQRGAFSREQALRYHSARTIDRRLGQKQWRALLPGVYCDSSVPDAPALMVLAALLYAGRGARASHATAGSLFAIDAQSCPDIHVTVPYPRDVAPQPGLVPHRSRRLSGAQVTTHKRIPTTSATRTIIDLADVLERPLLDAALADAIRQRLVSVDYLRRQLDELAGRACAPVLTALLDAFDPAMESVLEREYADLLTAAGLPAGQPQHEIWERPLLLARVDFAYVDRLLAVEIDGYTYHSALQQFEQDRRRERALSRRGWELVRFVTSDVRERPAEVVEDISERLSRPLSKGV